MKAVTLAVFNSRDEAEPVRQQLCDEGIWAEIREERSGSELLATARVTTGVKVEVPREDFERALQLVYDWNAGGEDKEGRWAPSWMSGDGAPERSKLPRDDAQ